jgi:hypothetical protein
VARGGLEGPGRECQEAQGRGGAGGVAEPIDGHYEVTKGFRLESGVAGGSWGEVGPQGEVPVSVARHREKKAGDPARGGEKARPGGGFGVSPPFLPLGQARTEDVGARWGSQRSRHPLLRPLGRGGRSRARGGSQSTEELSPRGRGGSRRLRPDCLADPGQEGQAEGRLSDSPQHQWAVKETPRGLSRLDFRVPELCPVWRRGWGGSCPLATPRQGMQGQDEALHRFWRGLTLVELWGPRPWVPPYPGPRDIKGERGGKVGYG